MKAVGSPYCTNRGFGLEDDDLGIWMDLEIGLCGGEPKPSYT